MTKEQKQEFREFIRDNLDVDVYIRSDSCNFVTVSVNLRMRDENEKYEIISSREDSTTICDSRWE